jgi:hypothetical protein
VLFAEDAHTLVDLGLSVNMQHERFAAHADHPCNGGRITQRQATWVHVLGRVVHHDHDA